MNQQEYREKPPIGFRSVFEAMPGPALVLLPDAPAFTILAVNDACLRTMGLERERITGKPYAEVFSGAFAEAGEDGTARLTASLHLVLANGQPHTIPAIGAANSLVLKSIPVTGQDGTVHYILHTLASPAIISSKEDAPSIPAKDAAKQDASGYLQVLIDAALTGIFLLSPVKDDGGDVTDFRFVIANRILADYVNQKPETLIGGLCSTWFPDYKTNGLFASYLDTYITGKSNRLDFHYHADGIDAWLDIMSTQVEEGVLVTFADYTQLKQMQQRMEASLTDLQRSNNNLEEFAYVASHDLREPLRKIKAFGDILAGRYKEQLGTDGADMINRMQGAAGRMKTLIEDLLTFSRISAQNHVGAPVNLDDLLQEVLTDLESAIKESGAQVHIVPLHPMVGDAVHLRQVFQNLISNALKFAKKGEQPRVDVSTAILPGSEIADFMIPAAQRDRIYQRIEVRDYGIGFEQQYAERIFQLFQRLHGRMEYPGTGIGLSIVQKVIIQHKGFIRAESTPGEGAVFTMLLPVA